MLTPRKLVPHLVTGLVAGLVVATGPSLADAAKAKIDADTVDGKHAVGARTSPAKRAGKLVATDKKGRLPDDIIAKAPNADRLGGVSAGQYVTRGELDGRASSRLVAVGLMGSTGSLSDAHTSGPVTGSRISTGLYSLQLPGLRPGCTGDQPVFTGAAFVGVFVTVNSVQCSGGNVTIFVALYLANGSFYDTDFYFAVYGP